MKIRFVSDVHTEFFARDLHKIGKIILRDVLPELPDDAVTTLILCGDIGSMHKPECLRAFLDHVAPRFEEVLYVPGNHEPYGGGILTTLPTIQAMVTQYKNVHFSDMMYCDYPIEGGRRVEITGCTLWTDMGWMGVDGKGPFVGEDPRVISIAGGMMNDYRLISADTGGQWDRLLPSHTIAINKRHVQYLYDHVTEGSVVFTHHAPSWKSVSGKYTGQELNGAYANNLDEFILSREPAYWLHGHCHDPVDYWIGKTHVMSNPRGYVGEVGLSGFRPDLVLEV